MNPDQRLRLRLRFTMGLTFALAFACGLWGLSARAEIAVSSNDAKVLLKNGTVTLPASPPPDTLTVIDLGVSPPKVLSEIAVPGSVVGPPSSVAVSPDESYALVARAQNVDAASPDKLIWDKIVSVVDLQSRPPRVIATHEAGAGPSGIAINRSGTLALIANRGDGTVSIFTIAGKVLTPAGKIDFGDSKSGPSAVVIARDGKSALVSRDGDHRISILTIDGAKVEYPKRDLFAGLRPYALDVSLDGKLAAVGNIGLGVGDTDTVSLIDMTAKPGPRVVDTITVGPTPEGVKISPDGKFIAVTVQNYSNRAPTSPLFNDFGWLKVLRIDGVKLSPVAEMKNGHWCQGVAWSKNSATLLVQCMVEKEIEVYGFDGSALTRKGGIAVGGGPAAIRTSEP